MPSTANPHFLDEHTIVYDAPATGDDINSAHIALLDTKTNTVQRLSKEGVKASGHMRSKNSTHEVVVYEEMTRPITADDLKAGDASATELAREQSIVAQVRDNDTDFIEYQPGYEAWHRSVVCAATGDVVNCKPVVTQQEDGRAACIWQQGHILPISSKSQKLFAPRMKAEGTEDDNDAMFDAAYTSAMNGHLMLSVFDGGKWSDPVKLFELNETNVAKQYDLVMRDDTVLVGMNMTHNFYDDEKRSNQFTYASIPFETMEPTYVEEQLHPMRFFMNRVGDHALIALLYEKNDTLSDIYVKALNMNGKASGVGGNDLGANFCSPNLVKIICDRESVVLSDCAILWAEMSNTVHGDQGTAEHNGDARMILNASRISLEPSICVTSPITMGAETEGRLMQDFDGFLDDQHMKVVYSLRNLEEKKTTVIMANERYFDNSFIFDVDYTKGALMGSSTLPITVSICNTGTSAIRNVIPTINGQTFTLDDSWVQPLSQRDFVVEYPIGEDFNGYLEASVGRRGIPKCVPCRAACTESPPQPAQAERKCCEKRTCVIRGHRAACPRTGYREWCQHLCRGTHRPLAPRTACRQCHPCGHLLAAVTLKPDKRRGRDAGACLRLRVVWWRSQGIRQSDITRHCRNNQWLPELPYPRRVGNRSRCQQLCGEPPLFRKRPLRLPAAQQQSHRHQPRPVQRKQERP